MNYDTLEGIYFNFNNYAIEKFHTIVAFYSNYSEKIYNCLTKVINKNNKIELSGVMIKTFSDQGENLYSIKDITSDIEKHKTIVEITEYQNILIKFLNSYICKNIVNSYFKNVTSISSLIIDSINYFRNKWCEYFRKNKNIDIDSFLKSIQLDDLLFLHEDFENTIKKELIVLTIIFNLLLQLKIFCPEKNFGNEIDINKIDNIHDIILVNTIILVNDINSQLIFIKQKEIDNLIKYPQTSFDIFVLYDKNGIKVKISRKAVEETKNNDINRYIEIADYSDYEKKYEIILVNDLQNAFINKENELFTCKNKDGEELILNKMKIKIIKQSDKFIDIPEQGVEVKNKLISEIQSIKDSFVKIKDSKTDKDIFLRISQLNEINNYKPKIPFINFEVFNNENEKVYTTKDICKKILDSTTIKKYILCYDEKEKENEFFVPLEDFENTNLDADDLFDVGNEQHIAFKNIRIKKLNEATKLGVQPEEEKLIKICNLIFKINDGPLNQSFKIDNEDVKLCHFISNNYINKFKEEIKENDFDTKFELNDVFGKNKIILTGSVIIKETMLGNYVLIKNKIDSKEYLVNLSELLNNLCLFKSTDDEITLINSINNEAIALNPLFIDIIPPFDEYPLKKI